MSSCLPWLVINRITSVIVLKECFVSNKNTHNSVRIILFRKLGFGVRFCGSPILRHLSFETGGQVRMSMIGKGATHMRTIVKVRPFSEKEVFSDVGR